MESRPPTAPAAPKPGWWRFLESFVPHPRGPAKPPHAILQNGQLIIDGKPEFLWGGEVQYFRVRDKNADPAETFRMWEETLDQMVDAGMNLITTYVPWDYHETKDGESDFTGAKSVRAFLDLAATKGLHVILKPGPGITGEWPRGFGTFGAIPEWWKAQHPDSMERKPDGKRWTFSPLGDSRSEQPAYLDQTFQEAVDGWYSRFAQEIRPYLGNTVVGIQLDNETNLYWGNRFGGPGYAPSSLKFYRGWLKEQYGDDLGKLNQAYGSNYSAFDDVEPPQKAPKPGDGPAADAAARDWLGAGRAQTREYLARLRASLEKQGIKSPDVFFLTNDAPFTINNGDRLIQNVVVPDGQKNAVGLTGADLYPKFDFDPRTLQSQPFQADFYTRVYQAWSSKVAGDEGLAFGAELQGGMYGFIPGLRPNIRPEATDQLLARTIGRGMKGGSLYVMRDGLNADNSAYDYQAAMTRGGLLSRRYDVIQKWGHFISRYGRDLLDAKEVLDPVAILFDADAAAPSGVADTEQQLRHTISTPAIFGWLASAGLNPAIVDPSEAKDLSEYKLLLRLSSPHPAPEAGPSEVLEVGGKSGISEAMVGLFNRGQYYLADDAKIQQAVAKAKELAEQRGIQPAVSTADPKAIAWARRSPENLYVFCVNDRPQDRDIHVTLRRPYELGLIKIDNYVVSDGSTGEVLGTYTGKQLLQNGLDLPVGKSGARTVVIRSAKLPPVPMPEQQVVTRYVPGLARGSAPADPTSNYQLLPGRFDNVVGLDDLEHALADPVQGRKVSSFIRTAIYRGVGLDVPREVVSAGIGGAATVAKHLAVPPALVRPLYQTVSGLQGIGSIPVSDYKPPQLPAGFDLAKLREAPVKVPDYGMREVAPGLLLGDYPGPIQGEQAVAHCAFAAALNTLADNDAGRSPPVPIQYSGQQYTSVRPLLEALRQNGHIITARMQERVANFIPLLARGADGQLSDVPTPIMLSTGIQDDSGKEVVVPAVHAEWAFEITPGPNVKGPPIQAEVTWFLGTGAAAAFYPNGLVERRPWQGHKVSAARQGGDAIRAVDYAARYGQALNRAVEKDKIVGGAYGVLGVCQDSVAAIQQALDGTTTLFPLLQDAQKIGAVLDELEKQPGDPAAREAWKTLAKAVRSMPHDFSVGSTTRERVLASLPHPIEVDPFAVSVRARQVLTNTEQTLKERGVAAGARLVAHGFKSFDTLGALRPSEMSAAFHMANSLHSKGVLPQYPAEAGAGPKALDMSNGVYRLDAVIDDNLGKSFELETIRKSKIPVREPGRSELLPGLFVGYGPSSVAEEQRRFNMIFAETFDRLAKNPELPAEEQFEARFGGVGYRRLDEYVEALQAAGYEIEAKIEGHAAHATGLAYLDGNGKTNEIPTPILVRTGVTDALGQEAIVPALHSNLVLKIKSNPQTKGPRVDADIVWYTGLRGTHFYPSDLYAEPDWSGSVEVDRFQGAEIPKVIHLAGVFGAATNTHAKLEDMWLNGYGILGVCNDAVAAVQRAIRGKADLYPLLMDRKEDLAALMRPAKSLDPRDLEARKSLIKQVEALPTDHSSEATMRERALASLPTLADGSMLPSARSAKRILGGRKPGPITASQSRLRAVFDRIDARSQNAVDRRDVEGYFADLGLGSGFLGPQIIKNGARVFLEKLDENGDQRVTYAELVRRSPEILPKSLRGPNGVLEASRVDATFDAIAGVGSTQATIAQLTKYLREEYTKEAQNQLASAMAARVAEVAARIGVDVLDGDGDGFFTRDDLRAVVQEAHSVGGPSGS